MPLIIENTQQEQKINELDQFLKSLFQPQNNLYEYKITNLSSKEEKRLAQHLKSKHALAITVLPVQQEILYDTLLMGEQVFDVNDLYSINYKNRLVTTTKLPSSFKFIEQKPTQYTNYITKAYHKEWLHELLATNDKFLKYTNEVTDPNAPLLNEFLKTHTNLLKFMSTGEIHLLSIIKQHLVSNHVRPLKFDFSFRTLENHTKSNN